MIVKNADGSIQYAYNVDGSLSTITRDPDFIGPLSTATTGIKGNGFNDPVSSSGSWFDNALENINELGVSIYDLGVAGYNKVSANVNRIVDSSSTVVRSVQSGIVNSVKATPLGQAATSATDGTLGKTVASVGDFFQSTLTKVLVILLIAAFLTIFFYSFIQAKAGRLANA